ncbi:MAG TPA: SDR family oxidoreductase [Gaiellaceae bacterium]|nr:SDR family oxidoreductase [Gaiellaceae bacterium]
MAEVAVVTGGSAGIGRATARLLADGGADVAVLARGEERLGAARRDLEGRGVRALALRVDVADAAAVEEAAARVEADLGPISVWVNNAMATVFAPAWAIDPDEYRRATEVTYLGAVHGTLAALRRMRPRDRGTIVQVGSALAFRGIPLQAPYCASKHALQGFTESVRTELLHERSRVHLTMVHLPAHNTPQFEWGRTRMPRHPRPVPPIFQPEVAAEAIVAAARLRRRELFVGWPTLQAVWGNRLAPSLVDLYLARTGVRSQQTDEGVDLPRLDNLFEPAPGDYAAHGTFDAQARDRSLLLSVSLHRNGLAFAAGALLTALALRR